VQAAWLCSPPSALLLTSSSDFLQIKLSKSVYLTRGHCRQYHSKSFRQGTYRTCRCAPSLLPCGAWSAIPSCLGFSQETKPLLVLVSEMPHEGGPLPRDAQDMHTHTGVAARAGCRVLPWLVLLCGTRGSMCLEGRAHAVLPGGIHQPTPGHHPAWAHDTLRLVQGERGGQQSGVQSTEDTRRWAPSRGTACPGTRGSRDAAGGGAGQAAGAAVYCRARRLPRGGRVPHRRPSGSTSGASRCLCVPPWMAL
jgi:hypothetical protein